MTFRRTWFGMALIIILIVGLAIVFITEAQTKDRSVWIPVPGNSVFGTHDFLLMKYDASCTKDGHVLTAPLEETGGYDNATVAETFEADEDTDVTSTNSCSPANGKQIASLPDAPPIVNESQSEAESYCTTIGAHLMTNAEWQTLAWNAERVPSNWSGGRSGVGYMYSGHNDVMPRMALVASPDDTKGYYGETNQGGNQRRTLTLSNGSVVWDMAGNIWQWTSDTIQGKNEPHATTGTSVWKEFPTIANWGRMTQQTTGAVDPSWSSAQGIGEIYAKYFSSDTTVYGFLRGGTMDYLETAGIESLGLFNTPDNVFDAIGFRCAK